MVLMIALAKMIALAQKIPTSITPTKITPTHPKTTLMVTMKFLNMKSKMSA